MTIIGTLASGGLAPGAPTIGTATDGGTGDTVSVAFTVPAWKGKGTGTVTYTATSSPGGFTGTSTSTPITVSGLTAGTAYTFTVKATTSYGVTGPSSAASNSVTPAVPASYESIASYIGTGTSAGYTFSNIPQTYKYLELRFWGNSGDPLSLQFNGDTGNNYWWSRIYATSSGSGTTRTTSAGDNIRADGAGRVLIHDYTSTAKRKTATSQLVVGQQNTGEATISSYSGIWTSTSAITSIRVYGGTASWSAVIGLYGIKG